MNIKTIIALAAFMLLSLIPLRAQRVMVVNIDEEIDATAWRHLRGALRDAETAEPPYNLLMVHLNTYGGAVDMADSMRTALMRCPLPTVAFVDHNAASAGALIVLACDSAYMAPGSSIGAATVVNGQGEPMPPKYQSYWSSVMRSTAAAHGRYVAEGDSVERWRRDPDVAAEMVNPERAVSFTTEEAVANGIVDGTATSVRGVLEQLDMSEATITEYTPTFTDRMMGFFASAGVRVILIMLILGGLYMEMHTPGLGFAAAVSVVATVLYFLPMIVTGTLAPWVVILFLIGVVALALEIFVIPGFGIAGVIGIVAIVVALLGAMVHTDGMERARHAVCGVGAGDRRGAVADVEARSEEIPQGGDPHHRDFGEGRLCGRGHGAVGPGGKDRHEHHTAAPLGQGGDRGQYIRCHLDRRVYQQPPAGKSGTL